MCEKTCSRCRETKPTFEFYKDKGCKDGFGSRCKTCVKECATESQKNNREYRKEYLKNYTLRNRDKNIVKRREYRENNREYIKEYHRNYQVQRRASDKLFRVKHNIRNRLHSSFKNNNWKKDGSEKLLGIKYENFIEYIESLFLEGMSWDNYGRCVEGDCANYWHIDHIIPLNTGETKEELEALCNYKNLRPLWANENLSRPKTK